MDPTEELCAWDNNLSFAQGYTSVLSAIDSYTFTLDKHQSLQLGLEFIPLAEGTTPPVYCDIEKYYDLQDQKDRFQNYTEKQLTQARALVDPFGELGRSIFHNRAAVKLANIDAVLNVTAPRVEGTAPKDYPLLFCDIASGPGSFTQYLQYRYPLAKGYGITLREPSLDWKSSIIDQSRFTAWYGPSGDGDLYQNWSGFVRYVLTQNPRGVDVVTGDGGFDLATSREQEFRSSRLLLVQALVGIQATKIGGSFVVKVFDTVTELSAHIIYLLALCFNEVILFKPVSSRPANAERYLVCRERRNNVQEPVQILQSAALSYTDDLYLSSILASVLPPNFVAWLGRNNNFSLQRQAEYTEKILQAVVTPPEPNNKVNLAKAFILWNIPDMRFVPY